MNKLTAVLLLTSGLTLSAGVFAETGSSDSGPKVGETAPAPLADSPPGTPNTYKDTDVTKDGSSPYKEDEGNAHGNFKNDENSNVQQGEVVPAPQKEDHE